MVMRTFGSAWIYTGPMLASSRCSSHLCALEAMLNLAAWPVLQCWVSAPWRVLLGEMPTAAHCGVSYA